MPDDLFDDPRLVALYDPLDPDRADLDVYADLVDELVPPRDGARRVLDVGCGTGTFAVLLAARGVEVVGVDPSAASLALARAKPGADRVRWWLGDATTLPPLQVDVAVMTGNVAQVFVADADWDATLRGLHAAVRPGGHLVLETRVPAREAWRSWVRDETWSRDDVPGVGVVEHWLDLVEVNGPLVTFRGTYVFASDGAVRTSDSTLRFRERGEVERSLAAAGFTAVDVRDAPDRPGLEWVFVARREA
ncbi:class I SAM-dependent methyltransferase [Cellulomonas biazotea]|uniref:Methyltransferase n=1 Tax=Cellulomonas biazotea TaxID=1709 RepID=A0A402DLG1_9CELL|nr:class I SAM-dependent methyltransferase [Cellulomonas biazotea]GCE74974.1 methyltransferase [Cellulomonas biazotea]